MRHCQRCEYLGVSGYEYPEEYCTIGIQESDPKFGEDDEGCGCHYNARTLAKMKRENEHREYLHYLGYYDYFLMPTMDYTEENQKILEKHRELIRHALGFGHRSPYTRHGKKYYKPYRNYFETNRETVDYPYWERLVRAGLAEKKERGENIWYFVTRTGMDWLGQHDGVHIYDKENDESTYTLHIETADEIDHGMARFEYCLEAVIYRFEDGYVLCPLLWSGARGCEECMEIFEKETERDD